MPNRKNRPAFYAAETIGRMTSFVAKVSSFRSMIFRRLGLTKCVYCAIYRGDAATGGGVMTGSSAIRYHMSRIPHVPGDVLCGNGRPKVDPVIESLLEDRRPKDLLSRYHAVFTVNIPDFRRLGAARGRAWP